MPETISSYNAEDSETFKSIAVFDCRGFIPVEFDFLVDFILYLFLNQKRYLIKMYIP
jgi:hypothetical protein